MMTAKMGANFFTKQLADIVGTGRAYGVGKPVAKIAEENQSISHSTLKALCAGRHIRPGRFLTACQIFQMRPLDFIEAKIRYIEGYLQEYLFKTTDYRAETQIEAVDIKGFFARREANKESYPTRTFRFNCFIETRFQKAGLHAVDIANDAGIHDKKNKFKASRQTVDAFRNGKHVKPEKFNYICRQLKIDKADRSIAKILYAEAFLDQYLLGEDPTVFKYLNTLNYPRTTALLIFSSENPLILP